MNQRNLVAVVTDVAALSLAPALATGQIRTVATGDQAPARTPWGDPNLQGVWNNHTVVPLERPDALAAKQALTDEEVAARFQENSERQVACREGDPGFWMNIRSVTVFGGSHQARLVERFTRVAADTVDYQYTIEDASTYTRP